MRQVNSRRDVSGEGSGGTIDLPAGFIGCSVQTTARQTVVQDTITKLDLDPVAIHDTDAMYDAINSRVIIQTLGSGWYKLTANVFWDAVADPLCNHGWRETNPLQNGLEIARQNGGGAILANAAPHGGEGFGTSYQAISIVKVVVGDYFELGCTYANQVSDTDVLRGRLTLRMLK